MSIVEQMASTAKGVKGAASAGGFFYFVGDAKGDNAALVVFAKAKDPDGAKTARAGRGLLKDFKHEFGKALFSQGEIRAGSALVFEISDGNAKPAVMKRAFKSSSLLHEGVGASAVGLLKGARIRMAAAEETEVASEDGASSSAFEADPAQIAAWAARPEVKELLDGLALSEEELAELFQAERDFEAYTALMPQTEEENTALQIRQAETEQMLDALAASEQRLQELLEGGDRDAIRLQEAALSEQRIRLAQSSAIGPDPFDSNKLSPVDQQAFLAAMHAGLQLLMRRLSRVRDEIADELQQLDALPENQRTEVQHQISARRRTLERELEAIHTQFQASHPEMR